MLTKRVESLESQVSDYRELWKNHYFEWLDKSMKLAVNLIDKDEQIDELEFRLGQSICLEQDIIKKARKYR